MESLQKSIRSAKSFWPKLTRKTFRCPQCSQRLRVPYKLGKTLQVNCSRCSGTILLDFKVPFIEVFRWQKNRGILANFKSMHQRFWGLPQLAKFQVLIWIITFAILIDALLGFGYHLFSEVLNNSSHLVPEIPVDTQDNLYESSPIRKI